MAVKRKKANVGYGLSNALQNLAPEPIKATRAPTANDMALPGTIWLDQSAAGSDAYVLLAVSANAADWLAIGSGGGVFDTLTVTGAVTFSALGEGVVQSSAAGVLSSSDGTDGELLIASTAGTPAWANIISGDGSVGVTNGANSIDLRVSGATASTFPTDAGIATPVLGATTIAGGTNVNTSGAADVVTINVDNAPTFSGLVTVQAGFTQTAGTTTITSDTDAAQAIYLHADGGNNETIQIHSDQGTGFDSIYLLSDDGGITIESNNGAASAITLNAPTGGIDFTAGDQINLQSTQNQPDAISIEATAGGIEILASGAAAGEDIDITATGSSVNVTSTEDAANAIYLHANGGTSETIQIYSDQGTGFDSVRLRSDVGGIQIDTGLAAASAITLDATAGGIDLTAADQINIQGAANLVDAVSIEATAGGLEILASGAAAGEDIVITATGSSVNITSTENVVDAIVINASDAAGGIDMDAGTGGIVATSTGGDIEVTSTGTGGDNIYLRVNGGITEQIRLHSDQGTGVASIMLESDVGGITLQATGEASDNAINIDAQAGGVDIDAALQLSLTSTEDAADAIYLHANGGTSETIRIHSDQGTGTDSITLLSDVGGITLTSTGLAAADALRFQAVAGGLDVDAALEINIATAEAVGDALNLVATSGGITATSGIDAADAIYLHANAGTSETIRLHADQGSGLDSIELESDAGGVKVTTAALAATTGLHVAQGAATAAIQVGSGAPAHSAPQGSIYMRTDGSSTSTRMYINTDGATGWTNVTTAT